MRRWQVWAFALIASLALVVGCGGGGGGGGTAPVTVLILGRVLSVQSGGPTAPASSVQIGTASTLTNTSDGSWQLNAPSGSSIVSVDTRAASGVWTFTIAPATQTTDVGDLWVGPERVTLRGAVYSSTTGLAVAGALISFAGRTGVTGADGKFSLADVAYSSTTQTAFWGISGSVRAGGFFATTFTAAPNTATAGVVTVNDILVTPSNDPNPPPGPYNIWGRINPLAEAQGTIVTLFQGGTAIRVVNVGSEGTYAFWVLPGTYTITYKKGALSAPDQTVTLTSPDQVIQRDATLQ